MKYVVSLMWIGMSLLAAAAALPSIQFNGQTFRLTDASDTMYIYSARAQALFLVPKDPQEYEATDAEIREEMKHSSCGRDLQMGLAARKTTPATNKITYDSLLFKCKDGGYVKSCDSAHFHLSQPEGDVFLQSVNGQAQVRAIMAELCRTDFFHRHPAPPTIQQTSRQ